jgi:hypothetical protein
MSYRLLSRLAFSLAGFHAAASLAAAFYVYAH